jgi:outer membrane protein assembly factor BamB
MVTPLDIMQLPMDFVIDIIKNGRDNLPPEKKKAKFTASDDIFDLEALPSTTIFKDSATLDTTSLQKKWKVPMLMCVDSSPLVIRRDDVNIVIAGSQRGDLVCVDDISGDVLHRSLVSGKIEGDLSYLQSDCTDTETMIFIPTYSSVDRKHKGTAYALHLKGTSLVPSWEHKCVGEIKNKLTAFIYPGSKLSKRLLCATYDGSLTYLDAANGRVLQVTEDLGGAVHADPILIHGSADTTRNLFALVASCAWKGAVSCVSLAESSFERLWTIDLWTPVYSTPTLSPNSESQVTLCGVDGSVRSIKLKDGVEVWRLDTENRPIFTKCCSLKALKHRTVFGSHDGKLRCIDSDGTVVWNVDVSSPILSSPVTINNDIIFADTSGRVHTVSCSNGLQVHDTLSFGAEIFCSPTVHGGNVYLGCRDSHLHKLQHIGSA